MNKYLFDGLPPTVVTYIKVHLRHMYSTGLFDSQEREDLIQDLVLFYLERHYNEKNVPDGLLFTAFRTKASHIIRTRLRDMQSGLFTTESLNSRSEDEGFEPESSFSLSDLENSIALSELKSCLSEKQQEFVDMIFSGVPVNEAKTKLKVGHDVMRRIEKRIQKEKLKK